jgi:hypothetical protein
VGAAGGAIFQALAGGSSYHRAVAYGLWFAAALCLVLMPLAGSKAIYRRTSLPLLDSWVFVGAATALCVAGAAIDAAG